MRVILLLIAASLAGCSTDHSLITIKFQVAAKERLLLDRWQNNLLSSRAPTAVVDFDCFAVNVVGPGIPSMKPNDAVDFPSLLNGNVCTYPGPSSLLVANNEAGSTIEVRVPVGKDRIIQVAGLTSSDGCDMKPPFANILLGRRVGDPNLAGFTDIYEVGRKIIELTPNDNDRTLTITSNFSTSNDMLNCSTGGGNPNGGSNTPGTLSLTPALAAIHITGTFPLKASGGTSPYSYSADCSGCTAVNGLFKGPSASPGAPPNSGIVTVTDATNATATATVGIYNPIVSEAPLLWFVADAFNSSPAPGRRDFTIPVGSETWSNLSPVTPQPVPSVQPPNGFVGLAGLFDNLVNGLPGVTFAADPSGYFVKAISTTSGVSANSTVLVVAKLDSPSSGQFPMVCFATSAIGAGDCSSLNEHVLIGYDASSGAFFGRTRKGMTQNTIEITASGSLSQYRIHQLTLGSTTSSYSISGHTKINQGSFTGISNSSSKFFIGGTGVALSQTFKGAIAEVMLFNGVGGTAVTNSVAYLSKKYGLAAPP